MSNTAQPWWKEIERYQWTVLLMTWLGFLFDLMDSTLYTMVMGPALGDLLGREGTVQNIGWYGGLIFSVFLVGWALGGIVFGVAADYVGRKRTLMLTILIYALFTGLAATAGSWWDLGLYRFLTGLGVGGEWAAGAALLAETWPERARAKGAAILQTSAGMGYFAAAFIYLLVGGYSWRLVFLVGAFPAVLVFIIRRTMRESERWLEERCDGATVRRCDGARVRGCEGASDGARVRRFTLSQIFGRELRRDTIVGSMLAGVANFGFWGVSAWVPALIQNRIAADPSLTQGASASSYVSYAIMILTLGSLPGYFVVGVVADWWGRKAAFALFYAGAALSAPAIFLGPWTIDHTLVLLPLLGFFTLGIYAGFPIYLPELYPTPLRPTGAGFCFNIGRVVSAAGPFLTGVMVLYTGSFEYAISALSLVYLLGPVTLIFARETRGQQLA
ncbi:MAG: MFS transporter [Acidobacteria bacterium]|nr:MFS transporter [Acidobacteriota bacterium]